MTIRRSAPIKRSAVRRRPAKDKEAADRFREIVMERAGERCQVGPRYLSVKPDTFPDPADYEKTFAAGRRCRGFAQHAHHVVGRGMGGHSPHDPDDGLATCWRCHQFGHENRAIAERLGVIRRRAAPSEPGPDVLGDEDRDSE